MTMNGRIIMNHELIRKARVTGCATHTHTLSLSYFPPLYIVSQCCSPRQVATFNRNNASISRNPTFTGDPNLPAPLSLPRKEAFLAAKTPPHLVGAHVAYENVELGVDGGSSEQRKKVM